MWNLPKNRHEFLQLTSKWWCCCCFHIRRTEWLGYSVVVLRGRSMEILSSDSESQHATHLTCDLHDILIFESKVAHCMCVCVCYFLCRKNIIFMVRFLEYPRYTWTFPECKKNDQASDFIIPTSNSLCNLSTNLHRVLVNVSMTNLTWYTTVFIQR